MDKYKKKATYYLLLFLIVFSYPFSSYSSGSDMWYFKEFFKRLQPKEYYEFVGGLKEEFEPSKKIPHFFYEMIDDFQAPDQWTISFGPDMMSFEEPFTKAGPDPKENYLHWKKLDPLQKEYRDAAIPTADAFKPNPTNTSIMGVRALFFGNRYQRIMLTPKNRLVLKKASNYFRLEIFAFGVQKDYDLYVTLADSDGNFKKVYMGNLNYVGWKHLSVDLKDYHIKPPRLVDHPLDRRIEVKNMIIESKTPYSEGFFGTWLSSFRYSYRIPKLQDAGLALYGQFGWKGSAPSEGIETGTSDSGLLEDTYPTATSLNRPPANTNNNNQ